MSQIGFLRQSERREALMFETHDGTGKKKDMGSLGKKKRRKEGSGGR